MNTEQWQGGHTTGFHIGFLAKYCYEKNWKFWKNWKFDPTPPIKCKTHQIWPTLKWFFPFFVIFFYFFFLFFFGFFFFSGHANKWAPKSQCFSIIRILKHFIFGEVEQYVITRVFWHTQIHLTETGFENNSPLFYRKLTFSVEGKMGISEKLE